MAQHARKGAEKQAVTANRLIDGVVVYLMTTPAWSETIEEAAVVEGEAAAGALLARANVFVAERVVVEPYLFEIVVDDEGRIDAASVREKIRMRGPTVRTDLGKQAVPRAPRA